MKIAFLSFIGIILILIAALTLAIISPLLFPYLAYCEHLKVKYGEIKEEEKSIFKSVNDWVNEKTLKDA